ncbi:MAG: hypothetical protein HC783_14105 [Rhodobacteraceae bacterium]|nr:hypothetical protein [Paracoccaceae bacterium]
MRAALALCLLTAAPASANPELLEFMGGQGCTFGADRGAVAKATGLRVDTINAFIAQSLDDGTAVQECEYVVLGEKVCTIRLLDVESAYTVASPEIVAMTSPVDAYAADGDPGCFLVDPLSAFDALDGGSPGAGFADYIAFIGAGIISGDLRFYSPSVLRTPFGFQNVRGPCAAVPDIEVIDRSHVALTTGFGGYIRALGAETLCEGDQSGDLSYEVSVMAQYTATVQGFDLSDKEKDQPRINAWLWFEYDLIAMAAGWHEGLTSTERGTPRPPLCHYD